jgi:glycerol uptake facilitator-like aquaporin
MIDSVALLAEFLGTFLLVLSILASGGNAYAIGGTLAVVILLIGKLSGGHVNPAVSAAMYAKGSLSLNEFAAYAVSQVAGGVASLYAYRVFA